MPMTHEEEYEAFVGGDVEAPPEDLCVRCHNYPCECAKLDADEFEG
jgi:hypothetical protein